MALGRNTNGKISFISDQIMQMISHLKNTAAHGSGMIRDALFDSFAWLRVDDFS